MSTPFQPYRCPYSRDHKQGSLSLRLPLLLPLTSPAHNMQNSGEASPAAMPLPVPQRWRAPHSTAPLPTPSPNLDALTPLCIEPLHQSPLPLDLPLPHGSSAGLRPRLAPPRIPPGPGLSSAGREGRGPLGSETGGAHQREAQAPGLNSWQDFGAGRRATLGQAGVQHGSTWSIDDQPSDWLPSAPRGGPTSPGLSGPTSWFEVSSALNSAAPEDSHSEGPLKPMIPKSRSSREERADASLGCHEPAPGKGLKRSATYSSLDAQPPRLAKPKPRHSCGVTDTQCPNRGDRSLNSMLARYTAGVGALPLEGVITRLRDGFVAPPTFINAPSCSNGWGVSPVTATDCGGNCFAEGLQRGNANSESLSVSGELSGATPECLPLSGATCTAEFYPALSPAPAPARGLSLPFLEPAMAPALPACDMQNGRAKGDAFREACHDAHCEACRDAYREACREASREVSSLHETQLDIFRSSDSQEGVEEAAFHEVFETRLQGSHSLGQDSLAPLRSKVLGTRKGTPARCYSLP